MPSMSPVFSSRRSLVEDIGGITALYELFCADDKAAKAHAKFYRESISQLRVLLETTLLCITVKSEDKIVGFGVLNDSPLETHVLWEEWIQNTFGEEDVNAGNSTLLRYFVAAPGLEESVMEEVVRITFSFLIPLKQIFFLYPTTVTQEELDHLKRPFNTPYFVEMEPVPDTCVACPFFDTHHKEIIRDILDEIIPEIDKKTQCTTLISRRDTVIPPLFIRMARVEDHDDLVAVFNAQSEVITDVYGDYFIAELVEAQDKDNKAIVAEVNGRAVGLMCMTSDVDVNILAQCFDIEAYDNLLKAKYMRQVRNKREREMVGFIVKPNYLEGDLVQASIASFDFHDLISQIPSDGNLIPCADLLEALGLQKYPEIDAYISVPQSFLRLLWHVRWWRHMVGEESALPHVFLGEAADILLNMNLKKKKEIARNILNIWKPIEEAFWKIKEAHDERAEIARLEREKAEREAMKKAKKGKAKEEVKEVVAETVQPGVEKPSCPVIRVLDLLTSLTGKTLETHAVQVQEGAEGDEGALAFPSIVDTYVEENQLDDAVLSTELSSQWIILMHWWGRIPVTEDSFLNMEHCKKFLHDVLAEDDDIQIEHHESPAWLQKVPPYAKDCFCINLFCLDQSVAAQAYEFVQPAFALYPEKNVCVVTQPHTGPRSPLFEGFTLAEPKPSNTFAHILYISHRSAADTVAPLLRHYRTSDRESVEQLVGTLDESVLDKTKFVAEFDEQIVAFVAVSLLDYSRVTEHRSAFHVDDVVSIDQHASQGFACLHTCILHPYMERYAREVLQQTMRLNNRSCLTMECSCDGELPLISKELCSVAPRHLPALKKEKREKPEVATFANIEREKNVVQEDKYADVALSLLPKKTVLNPKITVTARIVVVGSSDTGISLLHTLLSIPHLFFASLILLTPGKLESDGSAPITTQNAAYNHGELRRLMLSKRVRLIDARMIALDREQRVVLLPDKSMLPYDTLVLTTGLQDDALHQLKIRSWGVEATHGYANINGALSCADPALSQLLVEGGKFIKSLIWNPLSYAVVYGRSLDAYCAVQGLLSRKVPPPKIVLVLPREDNAFHDEEVELTIHSILIQMGITVYEGYELVRLMKDNRDRLKALILRDVKKRQPEAKGKMGPTEEEHMHMLSCRILITADTTNALFGATIIHLSVFKSLYRRIFVSCHPTNADPDIFNAVHNNGLVYDGRLIVDANFCTTDPNIYAAGSLCEFTRKCRAGNELRHDQFNGKEVGAKVADALLKKLGPLHAMPDAPPQFTMPLARAGLLPGFLYYYHIKSCPSRAGGGERRITTNTLVTEQMSGQYVTLQLNQWGRLDSITFLGFDELDVDSLWGLVGVSEGYLNNLHDRWSAGSIPDIVEFLADDWAIAYFHDRFKKFSLSLDKDVAAELGPLIETVCQSDDWRGITPELLSSIESKVPPESIKLIQQRLVEYLRESRSHLKEYFLPEDWKLK